METPQITQEMVVRAAEHEIMLSFNDDEDAELFSDWWNRKGCTEFMKWASKELVARKK